MIKKRTLSRALSLVLALVLTIGSAVMLDFGVLTVNAEESSDAYDPEHSCIAYREDGEGNDATIRVTSSDMVNAIQMIAAMQPGEEAFLCLAESVDLGEQPFVYPGAAGTFVVLCTGGGCELTGTVINPTDSDGRVVGGLFTVEIDTHGKGFGHSDAELMAADQGYIDYIEAHVDLYPERSPYGPYTSEVGTDENGNPIYGVWLASMALLSDMVIDDPMWIITEEIAALASDRLPLVICTGGHSLTISDEIINSSVPGAFKIIDCITQAPTHTCGVLTDDSVYAYEDNLADIAEQMASLVSGDVANIWLASDINVGEFAVPSGVTVNICLNGHDFLYIGNAEAYGGELNIMDCTSRHYCHNASGLSTPLSDSTANAVLAEIADASAGDRIFLHLDEDMSIDATIPEGVKVGVCLNGHTLSGSVLNYSGLYTYDCEMHICSSLDSAVVYVDQAWADMHTVDIDGTSYLDLGFYGAVIVPTENIVLPEGTLLLVSLDANIGDYLTEVTVTSTDDDGNEVTTTETKLNLSLIPSVSIALGEYTVTGLGSGVVYSLSEKQIHSMDWENNDVDYSYTNIKFIDTYLTVADGVVYWTTEAYSATVGTDLYFVYHEYTVNDDFTMVSGSYSTVGELTVLGEFGTCECGEAHSCEKLTSGASTPLSPGIAKYLFAPDGTLRIDSGSYEMYVTEDTCLPSTLVIPTGVQLEICLNGFTLTTEYYDGDSSYGRFYYYDAVDNMMRPWKAGSDMPHYTGSVISLSTRVRTRDLVHDTIVVERGASLVAADCSPLGTGAISGPVDEDGSENIDASGIINSGTLYLDNVDITNGGSAAVQNTGSCTVSGGRIIGMLIGISSDGADASLNMTDGAVAGGLFFGVAVGGGEASIEECEAVAAVSGVLVAAGDVSITDSSISGSVNGVIVGKSAVDSLLGTDMTPTDDAASLSIGGGEVNVGYVDRVNEVLDVDLTLDDLGNQPSFIGIAIEEGLVITDDVDVNIDPVIELVATMTDVTVSDIAVQKGSSITVAEGTELENVYTVSVIVPEGEESADTSVVLPKGSYNTFVGATGYATTVDDNEDYVVIPTDGAAITANPYGWEVSADGAYIITMYAVITDAFYEDETSRIVVDWKNSTHYYTVYDLTYEEALTTELATEGCYVVSIALEIAAKDYMEEAVYHYENDSMRWSYGTVSLDGYFESFLSHGVDETDSVAVAEAAFIQALRNNCMAAAERFKTANITVDAVSAAVGSVDADRLAEWARVTEGEMQGFRMHSATLLLESRCAMRFYFVLDEGVNIEDIAITVDGVGIEAKAFNSEGYYYVEIDGVDPAELGVMRQVKIGDYSFGYSPLTYVYNILMKSDSYTQSDINIAVSLYNVYLAAESYFGTVAGADGETAESGELA
ncbi:MAG: hypothetical protein IJX38_00575 [Clostridia bacterium]|nr:hypothetical protein [Clostridia bacterium]